MKILFCFYPLFVHYNHGIALLSSLCKDHGIETELLMLSDLNTFDAHTNIYQYDYICFSSVVKKDFEKAEPFIKLSVKKGFRTLIGGVYLRHTNIQVEGAYTCPNECERLPNILINNDLNALKTPQFHEVLGTLPLPDYEIFKGIPFDRRMPFLDDKDVLPYYSSRGCPYSCSFCLVNYQSQQIRVRCKVGEDLRFLTEKYKPDVVFIGDELLPYYYDKWLESWGRFEFSFVAYIRADIPEKTLHFLIDKGLSGCAFGVESGNEEYRNSVLNKNLKNKDLFRTVGILNDRGVPYSPYFMRNTPDEKFTIKKETYDMSKVVGGFPVTFNYEVLESWV